MSEYMERHNSSRMIGSPPGYVGYEEGGQLTEQVRRRPYSVVLFDEIEKAHPDVMNMLLQILEEGKLTDNVGRVINFRNTIILLTSNVGAETIRRGSSMGFSPISDENTYDKMREKIHGRSEESVFKPEFMNRLDDIIVFRPLIKSDLLEILDLEVGKVIGTREEQSNLISSSIRPDVPRTSWWKKVTIRSTERVRCAGPWTRFLEDPLAEEILKGNLQPATSLFILWLKKANSFSNRRLQPRLKRCRVRQILPGNVGSKHWKDGRSSRRGAKVAGENVTVFFLCELCGSARVYF